MRGFVVLGLFLRIDTRDWVEIGQGCFLVLFMWSGVEVFEVLLG